MNGKPNIKDDNMIVDIEPALMEIYRKIQSDIPIVGTLFLRQGGLPQRYVNNAYNTSALVEKAQATANKFKRDGDVAGYKGVLARHPELKYYKAIRENKEAITELIKMRSAKPGQAERIDDELRRRSEVIRMLYKRGLDE